MIRSLKTHGLAPSPQRQHLGAIAVDRLGVITDLAAGRRLRRHGDDLGAPALDAGDGADALEQRQVLKHRFRKPPRLQRDVGCGAGAFRMTANQASG